MFLFGKKKSEEQLPLPPPKTEVDLLLTHVGADKIVFKSRRPYPLKARLYLNATAPTIENVRSTGLQVVLTDTRKVGKTTFEYQGRLVHTTPALLQWLEQVKDQGPPTDENQSTYVCLHLDQRLERRSYRTFQVMSPDLPGYKAVTCDISRTGVRLHVLEKVEAGQRLLLKLIFDDFNISPAEVTGEVLWRMDRDREGYWIGLRFVDISDEAHEAISEYMNFAEGYKKKRFRGV